MRGASNGGFGSSSYPADAPTSGIRISGVLRPPGGAAPGGSPLSRAFAPGSSPAPFAPGNGAEAGGRRGRHGTDDVPVVTGVPVGRPTPSPAAPFDVFTPMHRPEQDAPAPADAGYRQAYPDFGGAAPEPPPRAPTAAARTAAATSTTTPTRATAPAPASGTTAPADGRYPGGDSGGRQRPRPACLAASARPASPRSFARSGGAAAGGPAGVAPASAASLSDMRNTLSAMQRGWQQGRSQTQPETEDSSADGE